MKKEEYIEMQFGEILAEIRDWIESGDYRESDPGISEQSGDLLVDYVAEYIFPERESEEDEEYPSMEIPLTVRIAEDSDFKLAFNQALFELYYRGYETEEVTSVIQEFMTYCAAHGKVE